jgi:hypothetical protein
MGTKKRKKSPLQQTIERKVRRESGQGAILVVATTTSGIAKSSLKALKERHISVKRRKKTRA